MPAVSRAKPIQCNTVTCRALWRTRFSSYWLVALCRRAASML